MPMRFADLDGSLIDVYQATTQMTDESGITYSTHINTLLDNAIGAPGYYARRHDEHAHGQRQSRRPADRSCMPRIAKGVPVVSARQMLTWLDGRNGSSFGSMAWTGDTLSFTIAVGTGANGLQAMVPTTSADGALTGITPRRIARRVHDRRRSRASSTHSSRRPRAATKRRTRSTPTAPVISAVTATPTGTHGHRDLDDG